LTVIRCREWADMCLCLVTESSSESKAYISALMQTCQASPKLHDKATGAELARAFEMACPKQIHYEKDVILTSKIP
jgi:hypothetical protein